jgi:DNA repair photolyase
MISMTSLDPNLTRIMEPRTSTPQRRLEAIRILAAAGIPTGVITSPIIPGLNDHEIPALLKAAAEAGASYARFTLLRLPGAVAPIFDAWLAAHYPNRHQKVMDRIRDTRDGKLNEGFGDRMRGRGVLARQIDDLFEVHRRRLGLQDAAPTLSTAAFRRPAAAREAAADTGQMRLFE